MTENQKDQVVQNNQNGKQSNVNPNTPKKESNPSEKSAVKEDEKVKPMPAEEEKEHEPREHVFSLVRNPKSALLMAHARGAILSMAVEHGIRVVHYTPTQVKRLLTGSGKAGKEQIQRAIKTELGLNQLLEPHDVADAFAVALCHYYSSRVAA